MAVPLFFSRAVVDQSRVEALYRSVRSFFNTPLFPFLDREMSRRKIHARDRGTNDLPESFPCNRNINERGCSSAVNVRPL